MPPEGYMTVTINDEVAIKLARVMARHDLESMSLAIEHTAQFALNEEPITNTELARLLYHRLQTEESQ
jgi:uncharacterized protein (DUF1684 family)